MKIDKDSFYLNQTEPNGSCLIALRNLIINADANIVETIKWGMPCFCYKNRMFCFLWIDKKTDEPYILLVEGKFLNHQNLETGKRSRMKILRVKPNIDLPIITIKLILNQALNLYRNGIIKIGN